jgi:DNA ligase-1
MVEAGSFEFATSLDVPNTKEDEMETTVEIVRNFLEEAVKGNCEGLMVKTLSKVFLNRFQSKVNKTCF